MFINHEERSIICKVCFYGPKSVDMAKILDQLHVHFRATEGEHTFFETKSFPPLAELEGSMSSEEASQFRQQAERSFAAPYEVLSQSGTLAWFRTRITARQSPKQFDVFVDAFGVKDASEVSVFSGFSLGGADCVIFVADPDPERDDVTGAAWDDLERENWSGPIVLFANGSADPEELAERLGHEGEFVGDSDPFAASLEAFRMASRAALRAVRSVN